MTDFTKTPTRWQCQQLHQADLDCLIRLPERTAYFWRERTNGPGWTLELWDDDHEPGVNGFKAPDLAELFDLVPDQLHVGKREAEALDHRTEPFKRSTDRAGGLRLHQNRQGWSLFIEGQPAYERFIAQGPLTWALCELVLIHTRTLNTSPQNTGKIWQDENHVTNHAKS
jgi:hypothetical protein